MNKDLIDQFVLLQTYYRRERDVGRISAYGKAISALRTIDRQITNVSQIKGMRGIGPGVLSKTREYLDTGKIEAVEKVKKELQKEKQLSIKDTTLRTFQTVFGVGKVQAGKLYDQGMRSLEDLMQNTHLLNKSSRIALKYHDDLQKRVQRTTITSIYVIIMYWLNKIYGKESYKMTIAGSYRRGANDSGDIDCLISSDVFKLEDVIDLLRKKKIIVDTLGMKKEKFLGIGRCPGSKNGPFFRLDIEFVSESEYGSAQLYFTGSQSFNIYMRVEAKRRGLLLNEHGLFDVKTGKKVLDSPTEEEIFERLRIPYTPPERR